MKYLILIMAISSIIVSCDLSDPKDVDKAEIEDVLQGIQNAFIYEDEIAIMNYYHPEFLHGSDSFNAEQIIWAIRQNEFDVMSISKIDIELDDNFAKAFFTLTFDDQISYEPSEQYGDMSYFYREYDDWKICGNNFIQP